MKVASDWVNNNGYVAKTGSSSLKNTVMSGRSMVSRRDVHRGILHETGPIDRHGLRGGQLSLPLCNDHPARRPWIDHALEIASYSGFFDFLSLYRLHVDRSVYEVAWIVMDSIELTILWGCDRKEILSSHELYTNWCTFEDVWRCLNSSRFGGFWLNFLRNGVWPGRNSFKICISCESKLFKS